MPSPAQKGISPAWRQRPGGVGNTGVGVRHTVGSAAHWLAPAGYTGLKNILARGSRRWSGRVNRWRQVEHWLKGRVSPKQNTKHITYLEIVIQRDGPVVEYTQENE